MASSSWLYDVFPSFSGEDIRASFLSHFRKDLDRKLIKAYKDSEIERGQSVSTQLKNAIKSSRIAVVVLSENYASSSWCLDELAEIMRCKKELGQTVMPIFYGLDPSHVREQTGEFGKIFEKACKNKTDEKKELWRKALAEVAGIAGYHVGEWDNEETLVGEIVNHLLEKLVGRPKDFGDFVGRGGRMLFDSSEVKKIGIWGPAGIGKSTFAKLLYSKFSADFENSIFIDRGFISKSMDSYSTTGFDDCNLKLRFQQRLLSKLFEPKDTELDPLGVVSERLKHQKSLIVIDDLDDQLVRDALAGQTHWFGSGSRIIVTSTDKHLLTSHGISHIHEVRLPSQEVALEIFCRSAFKQNKPPDGFRELASEIASLAGSLPLGLNVLGSSLRGRNKEEWMDMLPRLRSILDGELETTLRFSYDLLNNKEQAVFRHIACLFNREKIDDIKMLLADSELDVSIGLKNLCEKSLLEVREGTVHMHRLLRKMGKEIVRSQSTEPGEWEFLVDAKDICNVFEENSGTEKILGISLNLDEADELHIDENAFKGMRNLRYLIISQRVKEVRGQLPKCFYYFPPNLRLLRLDGYRMRYFPSNFCPESLVELQIRRSKVVRLWKGVRPLKRLKIMDLRGSRDLKEIPDLSMATSLKRLRLNNCSSLVELPSSIRHLYKLKNLDMSFCTNLEILPSGMNLKSLRQFNLRGCSRLRNFPDISTNISCLDLSQTAVEEIPSNFRLNNGVDLYMEDMMSDRLWKGVQPLAPVVTMSSSSLMGLSLSNIQSLVELPSSFQNLIKLKELSITDCENLETLPRGINLESLDLLDLSGCSQLKSFPNMSTNISELYLDRTAIEEVPCLIEIFTRLSCLHMNRCHNLQCVSRNIYKLKHLETVEFSDCGALTEAGWNGSPNVVAMGTDNAPKVKLNLLNCFKLDQEALYQQQSVFFKSIEVSGEEVPLYFTHRTTGTSLDIPLLQTPSTQYFRFRACTLVGSESFLKSHISFNIHVSCRFTDRPGNHFDSAYGPLHFLKTTSGSHLIIFDCCCLIKEDNAPLAEHNYNQVVIRFRLRSHHSQLKIKGCGVRVLEDCEGNKGKEVDFGGHETKHSEESVDSEECETDGILRDEKSYVNAMKSQVVRGGKMFSLQSRSGGNSIDNRRVDPAKEQSDHGKVSESSTMVTDNKQTSQHQVFINYWGEEVRFSFISHLVYALSTRGVNVFTDKYEKRSEDLGKTFQSIEDSNIALVVFSSTYTESRWCLDELVKIKERMDKEKLLTIPIFYNVEPSEVKHLEGDFGLQLWNLWRIHRDHRIIKWKEALESISTRMDFCLKDHSSESKFISLIAEKILSSISLLEVENPSLLPSSGKVETTKVTTGEGEYHESFHNKFGMEQRMKQLEKKLEFDCNETRIIGVTGMPGIGKTTLAKMLHEKWNCKFVRCVPLLGIRKLSEYHEPEWLRKTFLEVLFGGKFQISNEKTTHESVKDKLLQAKVFVVLDDVSDKTQLKYLLDDLSWIKKGSKIVITSCDKSLIQEFVHDTYVVPPLKFGEALQLFSYHAFDDHVFHPTVTSMKLCREIVDCAGGNPLVIKLLGKQLHGRDESLWEMSKGDLTHLDLGMMILDIFRFGYDLRDTQKNVFLDIACFFRSEDDTFVRSILDTGYHVATDAESEIRDLTHKGIISISGYRVEMHDLLYMFGKIYSSQALIEENGGNSRLWFTQEILDALVNQKDTESMRGIFLDMADVTKRIVFDRYTFINMLNLRYLKIYDSCCPRQCKAANKLYFPDGLEFSLEKVRYLHWVNFPLEELPPGFTPRDLVDLRLPYSNIERIWQGVKDTPWLKWVDLSHSEKLINLSGLTNAESLQRLNLEGCTNLDELPGEMQNMKSLLYLSLRGCKRLWSLPEMNLISLKTLILSNCSNLKKFRVISKSLEVLHLDGTAIKRLPPSIGNLQSLVLFNMQNCKKLEYIPNCLGQLKALEELILSGCSSVKNIPAVRQSMKHVQILLLNETGAKRMPKISCFTGSKGQASVDMSSLRHLCLSGNDFVSLRNDIGKLYNLTRLDVKRCKKLRSIPMLPPRLQYFDAHGCDSLEKVAHPLAGLAMTEQAHATFNFSNCNKLIEEAKDNIISYCRRRSQLMLSGLSRYNEDFSSEALTRTCFPGGEVPGWFSYRGSSVLEPQLSPQWCDSRFTGIALCAVILFPAYLEQRKRLLVNCNFEFKKVDGTSIHFSCIVGSWNEQSNSPRQKESSHVFIGYTSRFDINKLGGYDEEECFCTKISFEFQVSDGTEDVVGCQVLQCGFSLVYATDERENIFCDAKRSKGSNFSENKGGEISSRHHSTPSEESNTKINFVLRLRIDQLNERQKDVLFDLACFFQIRGRVFY